MSIDEQLAKIRLLSERLTAKTEQLNEAWRAIEDALDGSDVSTQYEGVLGYERVGDSWHIVYRDRATWVPILNASRNARCDGAMFIGGLLDSIADELDSEIAKVDAARLRLETADGAS